MAKTPAGTKDGMQRSALALIICSFAVAPGTLLFPASAGAIPASQGPLLAGTEPNPDFSGVVTPPGGGETLPSQAGEAGSETGAATLAADTRPPAAAQAHLTASRAAIPCMSSFVDEEPSDTNLTDDACGSPANQQDRFSVRFGERIGPDSGILGEFDGIRVDYRLAGDLKLNGIAGYPVLSTQDKFNASRQVFGVSAATGKFARSWDLNSYLLERQDNGQVTSREVGGALRYLRAKRSLLLFLNYDAVNHSLGGFMASGALKLPYRTTISATFDLRNSPLHKRQQRYLQQSMAATEGWTWDLPTDRITYFTQDLSEEVATLSVGMTHAFSNRLKLTGSFARLDASSVADADNLSAATTPSEYFYHLKLSGKNLMFPGDSNLLDLSHHVAEATRTSSALLDTRYVINRRWNVSPRLRTDYSDSALEKSVKWVTSPSVRMEYHWRELYGFKIEAGGEWVTEQMSHADKNQTSYYLSLGYKAQF
jgi:hypothetical protein